MRDYFTDAKEYLNCHYKLTVKNAIPVFDADGISIFYTNTDSEEIEVANYSIVEIEDAVSAVEEFFETLQLPKCIEWEEL